MKLPEKYQIALDKFVEKFKKDKNVIGIILSGSFVHSKPDKNSDLDVFIVLDKSIMRERGNTWINGVEIEYFINPFKQILDYFAKEEEKGRPVTAHIFANSVIIFERGRQLRELINKARKIVNKPTKKMSKMDRESFRYQIDDLEKDLEDALVKKDWFAFHQVSMFIFDQVLEAFFNLHRIIEEKPKRLFEYLKKEDKKFAELYQEALLASSVPEKYKKIISLVRYIENKFGGKRPREWKMISKCPCNEK